MGKKIFADLHNHTTASDGDFTPQQMIDLAKAKGIKVIGITDHDTIKGLKTAVAFGKERDIEVVCGVEVSICFKRINFVGTLHVLCYFPETCLHDHAFVEQVNRILSNGRGDRLVMARVAEINRFFGPSGKTPVLKRDLTVEDISRLSPNASRRHFAMALSDTLEISDNAMIHQIIGNDSPAYLPSGIDLTQAAQLMRIKGIVAVLAHPAAGSFPGKGHYKEVLPPVEVVEQLLGEFIAAGVRGVEVFYLGHTTEHQQRLLEWAKTHHLLVTGGSDCHDGDTRPFGVQGLSREEFDTFKQAWE